MVEPRSNRETRPARARGDDHQPAATRPGVPGLACRLPRQTTAQARVRHACQPARAGQVRYEYSYEYVPVATRKAQGFSFPSGFAPARHRSGTARHPDRGGSDLLLGVMTDDDTHMNRTRTVLALQVSELYQSIGTQTRAPVGPKSTASQPQGKSGVALRTRTRTRTVLVLVPTRTPTR